MEKALISPKLLIWSRNTRKMSIERIAEISKLKKEKIIEWEEGKSRPTINQAKKLAVSYKIPFAIFYLEDLPPDNYIKKIPSLDKRTFPNGENYSSAKFELLLFEIMERREIMIELYSEMKIPIKKFLEKNDIVNLSEEKIALYIREFLELSFKIQKKFRTPEKAFKYYVKKLEDNGILVFQSYGIELNEMRGLSVSEEIFPIIVVNNKDTVNAKIFTLFHELAHLITNTASICNTFGNEATDDLEIKCNKIAADALVPLEELNNYIDYKDNITGELNDQKISNIAKDFAVSREVIIGRLKDDRRINFLTYKNKLEQYKNEYEKIKEQSKNNKIIVQHHYKILNRVGKLYTKTVLTAYENNFISSLKASKYLEIGTQHFSKMARGAFNE